MPEQLGGVGRLQRAAIAVRLGPVTIDRTERRVGRQVIHRRAIAIDRKLRPRGIILKTEFPGERPIVVAGLGLSPVAVDMGRAVGAVIGVGLDGPGIGRRPLGACLQEGELQTGRLRPGVDAGPALIEHLDRRCRHRTQFVVGAGERQMEFGRITAQTKVGIHAPDLRRGRVIAPAAVIGAFCRDISRHIAVGPAGLRAGLNAAIGASPELRLGALIGEAVLHLDRQRAAGGVETEQRIVRHQGHARDRHLRDQVPVHDVAERLIDAAAILIHGNALRGARHGGCRRAAIVQIALERVAGLVAQRDARHRAQNVIEQRWRAAVIKLARADRLDIGRDLVAVDFGARHRRHTDNLDGLECLLRERSRR